MVARRPGRTRSGCTGGAWTVPPRSIGHCWFGRAPQRTTLGHALNLLTGAALRFRDRFGTAVPAATIELLPTPPF